MKQSENAPSAMEKQSMSSIEIKESATPRTGIPSISGSEAITIKTPAPATTGEGSLSVGITDAGMREAGEQPCTETTSSDTSIQVCLTTHQKPDSSPIDRIAETTRRKDGHWGIGIDSFLELLEGVQKKNEYVGTHQESGERNWTACCPAHNDHDPSLSVKECLDGKILVKCFAGCTYEEILLSLELRPGDLGPTKPAEKQILKTYNYTDAEGNLAFQVVRYEPKDFRQRRPDGKGGWIWKMTGINRVLYRLPEVIKAIAAGDPIYVVEGEKDADALAVLGFCATCNSGGAGKWEPQYTAALTNADVVIIPDKDDPGSKHAAMVAHALHEKAKSVKIVALPDRGGTIVKDAFDWIKAGGTGEELRELCLNAPLIQDSGDDTKYIQAEFFKLWQQKNLSAPDRYKGMAEIVLKYLSKLGRFFFNMGEKVHSSVMFFDSRKKILLQLASDRFQSWLATYTGLSRVEQAYKVILAALQDEALTGSTTTGIVPEKYWAMRPGAIYLSNGDGSMVRIKAMEIQTIDNGTDDVLFAEGYTLKPWKLCEPRDPFKSCSLFSGMQSLAPHALDLIRLWFLSLFSNQRCKPPLVVAGVVGSGKTRLIVGIFELLGIRTRVSKVTTQGENDFWAEINESGLVCFDNVDTKIDWLPDAVAAAATGVGRDKRKLYTDSTITEQKANSWTVLTSSNPTFASDPGLADRVLVIRLERRIGETAEATLTAEIADNRDAALSWVANTLSHTLADTAPTPVCINQRHPDFAAFAVRLGRALGREKQAIEALQTAELDKAQFNLENDNFAVALMAFLNLEPNRSFKGTANDIAQKVTISGSSMTYSWTPIKIGKHLAKIWPHLESVLQATKEIGHSGFTMYSFKLP